MYTLKNTKKEIFIMSPWIRENVINDEFLSEIKRLKESNCKVKIIFGYKNGNRNVSGPEEIVKELTRTKSLGFAKEESVRRIVNELYMLLGKENFIYAPPTHAKVVIVDDVITSGKTVKEVIHAVKDHGGEPIAVTVLIDKSGLSEIEEVPIESLIKVGRL